MMTRYWKIRKEQKWCASLAGGATCNSPPSWKAAPAVDEHFGVPTGAQRRRVEKPGRRPGSTEQNTNMDKKRSLTGKVIGRYKIENQWLVLNP